MLTFHSSLVIFLDKNKITKEGLGFAARCTPYAARRMPQFDNAQPILLPANFFPFLMNQLDKTPFLHHVRQDNHAACLRSLAPFSNVHRSTENFETFRLVFIIFLMRLQFGYIPMDFGSYRPFQTTRFNNEVTQYLSRNGALRLEFLSFRVLSPITFYPQVQHRYPLNWVQPNFQTGTQHAHTHKITYT